MIVIRFMDICYNCFDVTCTSLRGAIHCIKYMRAMEIEPMSLYDITK